MQSHIFFKDVSSLFVFLVVVVVVVVAVVVVFADFFIKMNDFKTSFGITIRVSYCLDLDQVRAVCDDKSRH